MNFLFPKTVWQAFLPRGCGRKRFLPGCSWRMPGASRGLSLTARFPIRVLRPWIWWSLRLLLGAVWILRRLWRFTIRWRMARRGLPYPMSWISGSGGRLWRITTVRWGRGRGGSISRRWNGWTRWGWIGRPTPRPGRRRRRLTARSGSGLLRPCRTNIRAGYAARRFWKSFIHGRETGTGIP